MTLGCRIDTRQIIKIVTYEVGKSDLRALHVTMSLNQNIERLLVVTNESNKALTACTPGDKKFDLKAFAKVVSCKNI